MATFLDVTLLKNFSAVFTWLLVWVISFGVLEWANPFGKGKQGLNAIISFSLAFIVLFTEPTRRMVEFAVPWFTVMAVLLFFVLFIFMSFGVKMDTMSSWVDGPAQGWVIAVSVTILIFALGSAFSPLAQDGNLENNVVESLDPETGEVVYVQMPTQGSGADFAGNIVSTFTHPKVLGSMFLLILGIVTITFLSKDT